MRGRRHDQAVHRHSLNETGPVLDAQVFHMCDEGTEHHSTRFLHFRKDLSPTLANTHSPACECIGDPVCSICRGDLLRSSRRCQGVNLKPTHV